MPSSIVAGVRSFVVANYLFGREDSFNNDASFMDEGIIDSTGILELVSHLEETYNIQIAEDELTPDNLDSVNRIASYLAKKLLGPMPADAGVHSAAELLNQPV